MELVAYIPTIICLAIVAWLYFNPWPQGLVLGPIGLPEMPWGSLHRIEYGVYVTVFMLIWTIGVSIYNFWPF